MFCCTLLYIHSSIAIILMGKRELIALLNLSSWCLVMVERLFLAMPRGCLQFVIVVFPDHTHLLFLGLLLFLAHINDMPDSSRSSDARLCADDSLVYRTFNRAKGKTLLQEDLAALEEWESLWQTGFNPSKYFVIRDTAGRRKMVYHSSYRLHGQDLEVVYSSKYLGIKDTINLKIVSQYDQEIPHSQNADKPIAPRGRATPQSRDTRKTN